MFLPVVPDAAALARERAAAIAVAEFAAQLEVPLNDVWARARDVAEVSGWQSQAMQAYGAKATTWSDDVQYLRDQARILVDDLAGLPSRVTAQAWGGL